ncbi:methylated-DNA--protein-cysteine methyltransferase, constitutive [Anoxybacillus sp. B7M1]|jgi:methylated-DNA-[protein]-cysteine S-methyltransferase|uniref:Methylated-DNA--protein-cysteine methyltransferase n=1 Tax=Anoxybacteroides rupiense TaxID=311460 RepID=A0ABT5W4S3_9BACL|nr:MULTISPECIES: methylated-DNA--[protein]-cysteine S-methyltransferase [Anoxybacillus]ANB57533.1 methylated-DNA--protein-cysteine methyltransferase, constitutive [Anoxybacillus sp. B2M1]ANB63848.1 methylated-DNA--protein-cysteine methyltransferase, constitutive [Anoxybacillus sp. B7M1]MBB3906418.1 methylated-DNA-[protein]-cysteine S-methyltransferase [Anoxybacillus rupiensis]MBS2770606.1 methylated-DNA--[protein]-cysteine S-methyltransferase [Anoxybacillus rupiensis]MDE8564323.1 methylated-DN
MKLEYNVYSSKELGDLYIVSDGEAIVKIELFADDWEELSSNHEMVKSDSELLQTALEQMDEYFRGKRKRFQLPLKWKGTPFQEKVWQALCEIPYGETVSYSEIAEKIGNPKAVRAVGQANRSNELAIVVPCHRVIGKNRSLTGYAGSRTDIKEKLLNLEQSYARE